MKYKKKSLLNSRALLQRVTDAHFYTGWVRSYNEEELQVQLPRGSELEPGEKFVIEVYGDETHAMLHCRLGVMTEGLAVFTLEDPPRYLAQKEPVRKKVDDISGTLTILKVPGEQEQPDTVIDVVVIDISQDGAGIISPLRVTRGSTIKLLVRTAAGPITRNGEVRYCKPEPQHRETYRVGVLLKDMGRLESARWARLLDLSLGAA
jgi:PilZ domain-containing protein